MSRNEEAFGAWASARNGHGQGPDKELEIEREMREHPLVATWTNHGRAMTDWDRERIGREKRGHGEAGARSGGTAYTKGRHPGLGGDSGGGDSADMWKQAEESKKKRPGKTPLVREPKSKHYIDPPEGYRLPPEMWFG